jgi:enamine deaminase RidA (YjgF/YER057c/UK114 family)
VPRKLISTGSRFEKLASYSRALIDGDMIYMAGTTGFNPRTYKMAVGAVAQTEQILRTVTQTLRRAGAVPADILRIHVFLADRADLMPVCRVIGRFFRHIRPANTTVFAPLATPEMKVEIEVTARRGSGDRRTGRSASGRTRKVGGRRSRR